MEWKHPIKKNVNMMIYINTEFKGLGITEMFSNSAGK
jgi:hypothetical protein